MMMMMLIGRFAHLTDITRIGHKTAGFLRIPSFDILMHAYMFAVVFGRFNSSLLNSVSSVQPYREA